LEQINPKLVAIYQGNLQKKVNGINYEWFLKSSNAIFILIGVMVLYFFNVNVPLNFNQLLNKITGFN
jgi:hypothetical protein